MNLSKSKYCNGIQCKKMLWLDKYKPEEKKELNNQAVFDNGNDVHELARKLLGEDINIAFNEDLSQMIKDTEKAMKQENVIITEASFNYNNNFCSVDILKKEGNSYEIYEVKSSTHLKDVFINDASYQYYVLTSLGLNVTKCFVVILNKDYVLKEKLNLDELFIKNDITNDAISKLEEVKTNIEDINEYMKQTDEPNDDIGKKCFNPYDCPFFKYCTKDLPKPNVFDIGWNTRFDKKLSMYYEGKTSYSDILKAGGLNPKADTQMNYELYDLEPKINKDKIKELLSSFTYPLYFLDFESYQVPIPTIKGTKPYQQICFQYSLHYYTKEKGELFHKEYLSDDYNGNPMYGLCKQLCEDIPMNSCVLVYNQSFEISRLKEMAALFPEFKDHLLNIVDNIKDLLPPFKNQDYYVKEMKGSASIKSVLPALFPNDPSLDYHNLEQVHKGDEASSSYLSLSNLNKEEQKVLRGNMLKYCKLDTYAMVKIYEKLLEVTK